MDWIAIPYGVGALFYSLFTPISSIESWIIIFGGVLGGIYVVYGLYLFFFRRVKFDWHLLRGHFLRKVIVLVLLVPFIITFGFLIYDCASEPKQDYSAKNLVYDENLYTYNDNDIDTLGEVKNELLVDSVFLKAHSLEIINDSIVIQKNKLPEVIISKQEDPSIFWSVYYHFIDPGNQHMTTSKSGRGMSALIAILGVFLLNGLLVSSIIGWIDRRKEKCQNGEIRYRLKYLGRYKFAVVIGANEVASSVIKNLFTPKKNGEINYKCEGENDYVILQTSRNPEDVRTELASHLGESDLKRVIVYKALRDSVTELKKLHIAYSTEIYVLGESTLIDGGETYHDAMNMRCVNLIAKELEKTKEKREDERIKSGMSVRKVCKVMFEYQTTSSIFQFSDISETIKENIVFIPFNRYESWARAVIADNIAIEDCNGEKINYTPLDGKDGISENVNTHVHFVIVGMSKMGIAMGVQAMLQAHYMNFAQAETEKDASKRTALKKARRTRITFIDTNADKERAFFIGRYENLFNLARNRYLEVNKCDKENAGVDSEYEWKDPMKNTGGKWAHLSKDNENFIDIEIEFIKGELESEGVRTYLRNISDKDNMWVKNSNLTIAICLTQTHQAVAASLYMPISVYEKAQEIWVYQREAADIILNLTQTTEQDKRYKKLKPFGMLYSEYINDRSQYLKALLVNGAYDLDGKDIKVKDRDMSNKDTYRDLKETWKMLSIDKKISNRHFADSILQKIRSVTAVGLCSIDLRKKIEEHTETLARSEHNRWNVQQLLLGYSPCYKEIDDRFVILNKNCIADNALYKEWKEKVNWKNLSPKERLEKKKNDPDYHNLAKGIFDNEKRSCKEGEDRMHPNLCAYDHLDEVDSEAKNYDIYLNSIIPIIKILIDDKIEAINSNNKA